MGGNQENWKNLNSIEPNWFFFLNERIKMSKNLTYGCYDIRSASVVIKAGPVYQLEQCCDGITNGENTSV